MCAVKGMLFMDNLYLKLINFVKIPNFINLSGTCAFIYFITYTLNDCKLYLIQKKTHRFYN